MFQSIEGYFTGKINKKDQKKATVKRGKMPLIANMGFNAF
jgi:hypothetical protein